MTAVLACRGQLAQEIVACIKQNTNTNSPPRKPSLTMASLTRSAEGQEKRGKSIADYCTVLDR